MADISLKYLGLDLKSPIMVSSCGLTADPEKVSEMEKNGVGAIVVKSLFEEQIRNEVDFLSNAGHTYPEMEDYLHAYVRQNSISKYTDNLAVIKKAVNIPVIASINCYNPGEWECYAKNIEKAGADAIELNLYELATWESNSVEEVEKGYCDIVSKLVSSVKIPVAVKISSQFTNIVSFVNKLYAAGAKSVVMFNRFFTPDIDLKKLSLTAAEPLSSPEEYIHTLRWTAIVSAAVNRMEISVTTGIHTPETAIKEILAGATTVQICSVIYKKGIKVIGEFNKGLKKFMDDNNFENLSQMRGRLNYSNIPDAALYERVQFMKTFGGYNE